MFLIGQKSYNQQLILFERIVKHSYEEVYFDSEILQNDVARIYIHCAWLIATVVKEMYCRKNNRFRGGHMGVTERESCQVWCTEPYCSFCACSWNSSCNWHYRTQGTVTNRLLQRFPRKTSCSVISTDSKQFCLCRSVLTDQVQQSCNSIL